MKSTIKIIFMGTPKFAVASLNEIIKANYTISGVITVPDKPAGRGLKLLSSDVKQFAIDNSLSIFQPKSLRNKAFIKQIQKIAPDIIVVVAFRKLPKEIWSIPRLGTFNLHGSLLPQYRGAAPINWAIINGEKKTGVTTFLLDDAIDTGKILLKKEVVIEPNANAGEVHDVLMDIGSQLVVETIDGLISNSILPQTQPKEENLRDAPKLFSANCKIDWNLPLQEIHDFVRGLSPYPGAWTNILINNQPKKVKILKGIFHLTEGTNEEVQILIKNQELILTNLQGIFKIQELQIEGKNKITAQNFINGYKNITL